MSPETPTGALSPAVLVVRDAHLLPYSFLVLQPHGPPVDTLALFVPQGLCTCSSFCPKCSFPRSSHSWLLLLLVSAQKSPLGEAWPGHCVIATTAPLVALQDRHTPYLLHISTGLVAHCLALPGKHESPGQGLCPQASHSAGAERPESQGFPRGSLRLWRCCSEAGGELLPAASRPERGRLSRPCPLALRASLLWPGRLDLATSIHIRTPSSATPGCPLPPLPRGGIPSSTRPGAILCGASGRPRGPWNPTQSLPLQGSQSSRRILTSSSFPLRK